ncbi:hypothetical protein GW17_00004397 [Ensete ventricosum]|nr:hypothetical protein GW17_00004397 [Ensete ventricosum]
MVNLAHLRSEGATVTCVADPHPPSLEHALDLARSLHAPPPAVILLLLSCLPLCAGKGRVLHSSANPVRVMASGSIDVNHKDESYDGKVPDIIDNAFVIVEFDNGTRGMLDLCMFAEGSKNEQEISVVGDIGKQFSSYVLLVYFFNYSRYDGLHHGSSYLEHLHFLSVIKGEIIDAPAVSLMDGLLSVAIGFAAQLSIEKGCFISIQEILQF